MKHLKSFIKQHKGQFLLTLLLLLGQVVTTLLIPALIATVIDQGILKEDMGVIKTTGIQMLLVAVFGTLISIWGSWASGNIGSLFGKEMRSKLFRKVQELSIHQFDEIGVSSMITRSTSDIANMQQTLGMFLQMVIPAPLIIAVSLVMTWRVSPTIAFVQLVAMALFFLFAWVVVKKSNSLSRSIQTRLDKINKVVRESITGVRVIRAFGNEKYEENRSGEAFEGYANNMIKLNRLFAVAMPAVWMLMGGLMIVVIIIGGMFSIKGTMQVGQITAVIEYSMMTMGYLMMAAGTITTLPKTFACLERLQEVLSKNPEISDSSSQPIPFEKSTAVVEFKNVTFAYPGAEEPVLSNLSFKIRRGETTAVVGSTGSGKSTLADLLLRLHDVQSGLIQINGTNIRAISQNALRNKIGAVPQKAFLFSGTIADNLRMGREDATNEELWQALRIAQAGDFVENLADGLLSPVAQGGTNFSGGQRQRLAIARALVKKADIFLFDDSFSALDVRTDAALRKALKEQVSSPAKLIIAQRVSSIVDADQILVLDEGKLVGKGTHSQLLETCNIYRAIAESQMNRKEATL